MINGVAGGALLTAWALTLGAGPLYTGLLVALPQIAQLFHIPGAWITTRLGHRRACLWLVGASRQVGLPLVLLPFIPIDDAGRRGILLVVAALGAILGVLGNNAWVAWMGELVPGRIRGRYFGRRTGLCMFGGALAAGFAGLLVDWARARDAVAPVLAALQVLACGFGVVTVQLLRRQHDPGAAPAERPFTLADAAQPFRDPRARGLLLYHLCWNAAVGLAGSFFALYMVTELQMGFTLLAVHGAVIAVIRMMVAPLWGVLIDRLGARPVLAACSFAISIIPFFWLLPTPSRLWPLAIDAMLAGIFWSGHALAAFALPLAVTGRRERPSYVAGVAAISGLAFAAATATGGALATLMPSSLTVLGMRVHNLQVLFVASGFLRAAAACLCLRVHEPAARGMDAVFTAILGNRLPLLRAPVPLPIEAEVSRPLRR